jgi:hypothetical protein
VVGLGNLVAPINTRPPVKLPGGQRTSFGKLALYIFSPIEFRIRVPDIYVEVAALTNSINTPWSQ